MSTSFALPADFQLTDDLDINNDENYVDPAPPLPLTVGNYQFRIIKGGLKRDEDGNLVLAKDENKVPRYPIIRLEVVELVGTEEHPNLEGKKVYLYQDFDIRSREVKDFNTGLTRVANNLTEILRSHDYTTSYQGAEEGLSIFNGLVEQKAAFAARFDWTADDWKGRQQALDAAASANGGTVPADVKKTIYAKTQRNGMKAFQNPKDGSYVPEFTSLSGETFEARAQIKSFGGILSFISSKRHDKTKFGPSIDLSAAA